MARRSLCHGFGAVHDREGEHVLNKAGGSGSPKFVVLFGNHFFVPKTPRNAMKHMILSFKMKGGVISDHFLMLWFQKDSLDTVGFWA